MGLAIERMVLNHERVECRISRTRCQTCRPSCCLLPHARKKGRLQWSSISGRLSRSYPLSLLSFLFSLPSLALSRSLSLSLSPFPLPFSRKIGSGGLNYDGASAAQILSNLVNAFSSVDPAKEGSKNEEYVKTYSSPVLEARKGLLSIMPRIISGMRRVYYSLYHL